MGRGDTKSAKGKISKGSYGKWRPKNKKKNSPKKDTGTSSESSTRR
ncbi:MAG: ribosomal small subunit protein bTHX [Planctomycetota bacterium]|jgi:ribosomal small subunit protein bTHX